MFVGDLLDGRYRVSSFVGRGVFSTVLRCEDLKPEGGRSSAVCIKVRSKSAAELRHVSLLLNVAAQVIRNNASMHKAGLKEVRAHTSGSR